jgi:hypothetical protein
MGKTKSETGKRRGAARGKPRGKGRSPSGRGKRRDRPDEAWSPPSAEGKPPEPRGFWRQKSIEELAREQGVKPVTRWEDVFGRGVDLWESDEEFERFVSGICERRRAEESA